MSYQTTTFFFSYVSLIYPDEFEIKDTTESDFSCLYPENVSDIDSNCRMTNTLYEKRDGCSFAIINCSFLCGNIPLSEV
jgi:hypothetical protein